MSKVEVLFKYFPELTNEQKKAFSDLYNQYLYWNNQINVISRKDIEELYIKHVLHSLSIAKLLQFKPGATILDVGTGGGFPGIPLAIMFPEVSFTLIDSIGKKIKVVKEIAAALKLNNVTAIHCRVEEVNDKFDFIVSRAVARINKITPWIAGKVKSKNLHEIKNGVLLLKGGDLTDEIKESRKQVALFQLKDYFEEDFFETKVIAYLRVK